MAHGRGLMLPDLSAVPQGPAMVAVADSQLVCLVAAQLYTPNKTLAQTAEEAVDLVAACMAASRELAAKIAAQLKPPVET